LDFVMTEISSVFRLGKEQSEHYHIQAKS
ncbi:MAG: hypothetical protein ACD_58C00222G0001, partial [uncultured bacterium]